MKVKLILGLLVLPFWILAQIQFQQVAHPEDFNIQNVRKSPTGEYFTQAVNNRSILYQSMDGVEWEPKSLPLQAAFDEIQFLSDGTPVITAFSGQLIRRDGEWQSMSLNGSPNVETSFVKGDTLFVYQDKTFAFSLDRGQSFTTLFQDFNIFNGFSRLWRLNSYLVLTKAIGGQRYIYVYEDSGNQILQETLDINSTPIYAFNDCGELLILDDYFDYYLLKTDPVSLTEGIPSDILPGGSTGLEIKSYSGDFYHRFGSTLYRSTGCGFNWNALTTVFPNETEYWVSDQLDIFSYSIFHDYFRERPGGSTTWMEQSIDIVYPYVTFLDESYENDQFLLTQNAFFRKDALSTDWLELDSVPEQSRTQCHYAEDGGLYIDQSYSCLYSTDGGDTFEEIDYPTFNPADLWVLDNGVLFVEDNANAFYSTDQGATWEEVDLPSGFNTSLPIKAKLVEDKILVLGLDEGFEIFALQIDLNTGEADWQGTGIFSFFSASATAILSDGTMYFFFEEDINGTTPVGFYRFQFGDTPEWIGAFSNLFYKTLVATDADELLLLDGVGYHLFNGVDFDFYDFSGLPSTDFSAVFLSQNQHLYIAIGNHSVYRSTNSLAPGNRVSGIIFHDEDTDCTSNPLDPTLGAWKVKIEKDQFYRIRATNENGEFSFAVPDGEYTVSTVPINANWDLCEDSYALTIDPTNTSATQDFQARGLVDCAQLELDFSTPFLRRCFDNYYSVRVRNTGPLPSIGTTLRMTLDEFFDLNNVSIPYTEVEPQVLEFDLGVLEVGDELSFNIFFNLNCDAEFGAQHCLEGELIDDQVCDSDQRSYTECQNNIGSYDPNDKRIFSESCYEVNQVDKG